MFDKISEASAYVFGVLDLLGEVENAPVKEQSLEDIESEIEAATALNLAVRFGASQNAEARQFMVLAYDSGSFFEDPEL